MIFFSDETKKMDFIKNKVGTTRFHSLLDGKAVGIPATINRAELNGRKLAIVGFNGVWEYEDAGWSGEKAFFQQCLNLCENVFRVHLMRIPGVTVKPLNETIADPVYAKIAPPNVLDKLCMGYFKYSSVLSANGLKIIHPGARATYGPWLEEMRALAQSLNC